MSWKFWTAAVARQASLVVAMLQLNFLGKTRKTRTPLGVFSDRLPFLHSVPAFPHLFLARMFGAHGPLLLSPLVFFGLFVPT